MMAMLGDEVGLWGMENKNNRFRLGLADTYTGCDVPLDPPSPVQTSTSLASDLRYQTLRGLRSPLCDLSGRMCHGVRQGDGLRI